jgi:hypothetical protein
MSSSAHPEGPYQVYNSRAIARAFQIIQRQASRQGRGEKLLLAARHVYERLQQDPLTFGEPLYRLPALRMQVRCVAVRPLYVDFAVCEDRPLVFIKAIRLLSGRGS